MTLRRVVGQNGNAGMNWEMKSGVLVYREVKCIHRILQGQRRGMPNLLWGV